MQPEETSREVRRVINAIHDLSELETQIPLCKTVDEVEEIRLRCQAIQYYDREIGDIGPNLVAWAKRCAVLCQLRITELYDLARAKKNGEVSSATNLTPAEKVTRSAARLVGSLPQEELNKHLETSQSVQLIARKVRKIRKKAEPKSTPKQLEASRARYYRNKAKNRPDTPPPQPKLAPSDKFRRYWPQEEKLLQQFFIGSDLSVIEGYWIRAFQSYRKDVEDGKRERQEALAKLKNTTPPERIPASE